VNLSPIWGLSASGGRLAAAVDPSDLEAVARAVDDAEGVVFVAAPASAAPPAASADTVAIAVSDLRDGESIGWSSSCGWSSVGVETIDARPGRTTWRS
jgi:hypothetical protein